MRRQSPIHAFTHSVIHPFAHSLIHPFTPQAPKLYLYRPHLEGFMRFLRPVVTLLAVSAVVLSPTLSAQRPSAPAVRHQPTIASFLKPGLPIELVSARKVDRIAWIAYEEGKRNVFTAAAPLFAPVRVTSFLKDDGVDLTGV